MKYFQNTMYENIKNILGGGPFSDSDSPRNPGNPINLAISPRNLDISSRTPERENPTDTHPITLPPPSTFADDPDIEGDISLPPSSDIYPHIRYEPNPKALRETDNQQSNQTQRPRTIDIFDTTVIPQRDYEQSNQTQNTSDILDLINELNTLKLDLKNATENLDVSAIATNTYPQEYLDLKQEVENKENELNNTVFDAIYNETKEKISTIINKITDLYNSIQSQILQNKLNFQQKIEMKELYESCSSYEKLFTEYTDQKYINETSKQIYNGYEINDITNEMLNRLNKLKEDSIANVKNICSNINIINDELNKKQLGIENLNNSNNNMNQQSQQQPPQQPPPQQPPPQQQPPQQPPQQQPQQQPPQQQPPPGPQQPSKNNSTDRKLYELQNKQKEIERMYRSQRDNKDRELRKQREDRLKMNQEREYQMKLNRLNKDKYYRDENAPRTRYDMESMRREGDPRMMRREGDSRMMRRDGERDPRMMRREGDPRMMRRDGERDPRMMRRDGERDGERDPRMMIHDGERDPRMMRRDGERDPRMMRRERDARMMRRDGERDPRIIEVPDRRPQNVVDDLMYILKDINSTERDRFYRVLNAEYSGTQILSPYLQTIDENSLNRMIFFMKMLGNHCNHNPHRMMTVVEVVARKQRKRKRTIKKKRVKKKPIKKKPQKKKSDKKKK